MIVNGLLDPLFNEEVEISFFELRVIIWSLEIISPVSLDLIP